MVNFPISGSSWSMVVGRRISVSKTVASEWIEDDVEDGFNVSSMSVVLSCFACRVLSTGMYRTLRR